MIQQGNVIPSDAYYFAVRVFFANERKKTFFLDMKSQLLCYPERASMTLAYLIDSIIKINPIHRFIA